MRVPPCWWAPFRCGTLPSLGLLGLPFWVSVLRSTRSTLFPSWSVVVWVILPHGVRSLAVLLSGLFHLVLRSSFLDVARYFAVAGLVAPLSRSLLLRLRCFLLVH